VALLRHLRHGALAGATAGALTAGFGFALAEPVMDRAVTLEQARTAAEDARLQSAGHVVAHHADVFSRPTQHLGLLVASLATGIAVGVLFGVAFAVLHPDARAARDPWRAALRLAAAGFFALCLVPFLRYPANPPGVGDPDTIDLRTRAYLAALAIGVLGVLAAAKLAGNLAGRGWTDPPRQLAVSGVLLLTAALTFALPANTDPLEVPAGLLWQFRLLALASSVLLWAALGVVFGLLTQVDGRRDHEALSGNRHLTLR
jgi:predicted cobalt transporter CbtA